ncbi:MAG TPA: L,D-transpeptidase family protein [Kiloniellales bacterium]|nr:L,D-transpeptidase family protein [Kiloniellales bacterium]
MNSEVCKSRRRALGLLSAGVGVAALTGPLGGLSKPALAQATVEGSDFPKVIGTMGRYRTRANDTLVDIARMHRLGFVEVKAANPGVDVWLPGEGTEILLPEQRLVPDAPARGIVINLCEMCLYYFPKGGTRPMTFPLGVGREGRGTPMGNTSIVRKTEHPTWYPPASIRAEKPELPSVVPPGPENPLGTRALYLGWPAYLIHGTSMPFGVGRRVSAGCIRMYNEDVETLYPQVPVGTPVTVVDQEVKIAWLDDGELYVEVSPSQEQADQIEISGYFEPVMPEGMIDLVLEKAGAQAGRLDWAAIERAGRQRLGYPIRITV